LQLANGVLRLQDLRAAVAGGRLSGSTQLESDARRWSADLRFTDLNIASWIRGLRADPAKTAAANGAAKNGQGNAPVRAYLTGQLDAAIKVTGSGPSTAEILGTLDGRARARIRNGTASHLITEIAGVDVAQALGVAVRGDRALPLKCARVDLLINKGVAVLHDSVVDNPDSTVRIDGQIDLRDETLALRAQASPKDFSLLSMRSPVLVGGTLSAPQVSLDPGPLLVRLAAAAALAAVAAPAAALLPLIDVGAAEGSDGCAELPKTTAASAPAAKSSR
jgi:uncharacterized protein involved in outer membrane biogenesis